MVSLTPREQQRIINIARETAIEANIPVRAAIAQPGYRSIFRPLLRHQFR